MQFKRSKQYSKTINFMYEIKTLKNKMAPKREE